MSLVHSKSADGARRVLSEGGHPLGRLARGRASLPQTKPRTKPRHFDNCRKKAGPAPARKGFVEARFFQRGRTRRGTTVAEGRLWASAGGEIVLPDPVGDAHCLTRRIHCNDLICPVVIGITYTCSRRLHGRACAKPRQTVLIRCCETPLEVRVVVPTTNPHSAPIVVAYPEQRRKVLDRLATSHSPGCLPQKRGRDESRDAVAGGRPF
jgi:hypothetical protein